MKIKGCNCCEQSGLTGGRTSLSTPTLPVILVTAVMVGGRGCTIRYLSLPRYTTMSLSSSGVTELVKFNVDILLMFPGGGGGVCTVGK
jgi:hypothetical protein